MSGHASILGAVSSGERPCSPKAHEVACPKSRGATR